MELQPGRWGSWVGQGDGTTTEQVLGHVLEAVPSLPLSSDVSLASYHYSSLPPFLQTLSRVHQSPPRLIMGIINTLICLE